MFSVFVRLLNHLADVRTHSVAGMFTLVLCYGSDGQKLTFSI